MCAPTRDCYMSLDLHMYITTSISKDETNDYRLLFHFYKVFSNNTNMFWFHGSWNWGYIYSNLASWVSGGRNELDTPGWPDSFMAGSASQQPLLFPVAYYKAFYDLALIWALASSLLCLNHNENAHFHCQISLYSLHYILDTLFEKKKKKSFLRN